MHVRERNDSPTVGRCGERAPAGGRSVHDGPQLRRFDGGKVLVLIYNGINVAYDSDLVASAMDVVVV